MTNIIIDCDPGHDDAAAILYAAHNLNITAITTVYGNNSLQASTHNALAVLELAKLRIPVFAGEDRPLCGNERLPGDLHGKSGLDGAVLPEPSAAPQPENGIDALIEYSLSDEGCGIIALGPLTNIARAMQLDSSFAGRMKWISLMGGSTTVGNSTAVAEFNIHCDPEAADIVFRSGVPIKMVGLNVTRQVGVGEAEIAALRAMGGTAASVFADLFDFYLERSRSIFGLTHASLHDPCAVVPLVKPELITYRDAHVAIELIGEHTRAMTVCDLRNVRLDNLQTITASRKSNADVAVEVRGSDIVRHVFEAIGAF